MYKIGVIGDKDSVLGFMAIGFAVKIAESVIEATGILQELVGENYAVIYITEDLAIDMSEVISKYKNRSLPAIIPIPGRKGSNGYGIMNIKKSVERAVGADILFKE